MAIKYIIGLIRIESFAVINLRGVSTNKTIIQKLLVMLFIAQAYASVTKH
jgi:hypothetical protein